MRSPPPTALDSPSSRSGRRPPPRIPWRRPPVDPTSTDAFGRQGEWATPPVCRSCNDVPTHKRHLRLQNRRRAPTNLTPSTSARRLATTTRATLSSPLSTQRRAPGSSPCTASAHHRRGSNNGVLPAPRLRRRTPPLQRRPPRCRPPRRLPMTSLSICPVREEKW